MKRFIIIFMFIGLFAVNLISQKKERERLPWDTITATLPPFEMSRTDTLRFIPGDTIPTPIWEMYLKKKRTTEGKTLESPLDNMPVIVPPDHQFHMIVVKPDTSFHYYLRNLKEESKVPLYQKRRPPTQN